MFKTGVERAVIFWLEGRRLVLEIALSAIVLSSYFLINLGEYLPAVFKISAFMLAGFYFVGAFFRPDFENVFTLICIKAAGVVSASCMVGIAFAVLGREGAKLQLMTGVILLPVAIYLFFDYLKSPRRETILLVLRGLVLSAISFYFFNQLPVN